MNNKIKLTEKQLNNIVSNSVYRALNESFGGNWKNKVKGAALGALGAASIASCGNQPSDKNVDKHYDDIEQVEEPYKDGEMSHGDWMDYHRDMENAHLKENKNNNMKKVIRLTESDLHRIIENSVRKMLKEINLNGVSLHGNEGKSWNTMAAVRQRRPNRNYKDSQAVDRNFKNMGDLNYNGGFDGSHEDANQILGYK